MSPQSRVRVRSAASLAVCAGLVIVASQIGPNNAAAGDSDDWDSTYITHIGRSQVPVFVRHYDFAIASDGGHPDFGKVAPNGFGRYLRITDDYVDDNQKPEFRSTGYKELSAWMDVDGRRIIEPHSYLSSGAGDVSGSMETAPGDAITSSSSFQSLFRSTPGVNTETVHTVNFDRQGDGSYLFSGTLDDLTGVDDVDYTSIMEFGFVYEEAQNAFIDVYTDGEAWMFVDGRLVIDAGWGTELYTWNGGIAADGQIDLGQNAQIMAVPGAVGTVSTNSTDSNDVTIDQTSFIDRDVYVGPGGDPDVVISDPGNIGGSTGTMPYPIPMPAINPPDDLGPSMGATNPPDGTVIVSDMHVSSFRISMGRTITIGADVRILVDGDLKMFGNSVLDIAPGASLQIWIGDDLNLSQGAYVNVSTMEPDNCIIYVLGETNIRIGQNTRTYAHIIAPYATLWMQQYAEITGSFIGAGINMGQDTVFTIDDPSSGISFGDDVWWPPHPMVSRIELNNLADLQDRKPYRVQLLFANRVSQPSYLTLHTNLRTMNLLQYPNRKGKD